MPKRLWAWVFIVAMLAVPAFALSTKSIAQGLTAAEVAATVTGPGATITNVKITGSDKAVGTFTAGALGVSGGIILSTGDVATAIGPNNSSGAGEGLGTPGDGQLNAIVSPNPTFDAAILEFDVVTATPVFTISYVFASEEYREYVDSEFNDVFAFFVDGTNIARTPGSSEPVSINTINHLRNTNMYRDNETGTDTQFDGFTVPMVAVAVVEPGVSHHIKIAIADAGDNALDSAVFIAQGGISGTTAPVLIPPQLLAMEVGQTLTVPVPIYFVFDTIPYTLTTSGLEGATVTFSPVYPKDDLEYVDMTIALGGETTSGAHLLTIRSATADAERFASTLIVVDCKPPSLLGIGQPSTQTVTRGATATFSVQPQGSGPFLYQWYSGFAGMTNSPISGGNSRQFTTPAVNDLSAYWVRITNACGTFDSNTTLAIPQ